MFVLSMVILHKEVRILRINEIERYYCGDRLVTSQNIPYQYDGFPLGSEGSDSYAVVWPLYYRKPINVNDSKTLDSLFIDLVQLPYSEFQNDPNKIWELGGNCQSLSIYFATVAQSLGYQVGFIPYVDHICNWINVDGDMFRVDIVSQEFSKVSMKDREFLETVDKQFKNLR